MSLCRIPRRVGAAVALVLSLAVSPAFAQNTPPSSAGASTGPTQIPPVAVTAPPLTQDQLLQTEGTAADGYRVDTVPDMGPWGSMPILDAPYSVNVMPLELLENTQTTLSDQVWQRNPFTQIFNTTDWGSPNRVATRGFFNNNQFIDGLQTEDIVNSIEDKQSVEVITGLSGFFYGPVSIGGVLESTLKRPTATPFADIAAGGMLGYGDPNGYIHGDFGGPIDPGGKVAYRINFVGQDGGGYTDQSTLRRGLLSGALDVHLTDNLLLQIDAEQNWYHTNGTAPDPEFTGTVIPPAPNNSLQWGQKWAFYDVNDFRGAARLTWNINDAWRFRAAYSGSTESASQIWTDDFVATDFTVTQAMDGFLDQYYTNLGGYAELDGTVVTGPLKHYLVFKSSYHSFKSYGSDDDSIFVMLPGSCSLYVPCAQVSQPAVPVPQLPRYKDIQDDVYDNIVGDEIKITHQLSILAGVDWNQIVSRDWDATGAETSSYHAGNLSPSGSLVFKPWPNVSTYFTYMEGLQAGATAAQFFSGLPVTNANQVNAPTIDHQYELGAKWKLNKMLLTVALFDIERATDVYVPSGAAAYTLLPSGLEEHRGIELGISGKVTPDLTLWGGATWFNAKIVQQPQRPDLVGKEPAGIAEMMAKIYGEYAIRPVPGLFLTGGVYYTGSQWVDALNTGKVPGFVTADIGARFNTRLYGRDTTFRFNVTNLAGANYWIQPGELGVPRTFWLTGEVKF